MSYESLSRSYLTRCGLSSLGNKTDYITIVSSPILRPPQSSSRCLSSFFASSLGAVYAYRDLDSYPFFVCVGHLCCYGGGPGYLLFYACHHHLWRL